MQRRTTIETSESRQLTSWLKEARTSATDAPPRCRPSYDVRVRELVPAYDWVCEILSPSTAQLDRARKLALYAREQVAHAWLVDPLARTLEVLRLEHDRWTILATHVNDEVVRAEPFAEIELELAALWADVASE